MVDQFPRDSLKQDRICVAKEIDYDAPFAARWNATFGSLGETGERGFEPSLHDVICNAIGDGVDELPLFFQEWTFVRSRHLLPIAHLEAANVFSLDHDGSALDPLGWLEVWRRENLIFEDNAGLTLVRVLPGGRKYLYNAAKNVFKLLIGTAEQLIYSIQTVQLFRPFL